MVTFVLFFSLVQVHYILQEIVMGGMVLETNMSEILTHIEAQNKIEKSEVSALCTLHQWNFCSLLAFILYCCVVHDNHEHFIGLVSIYIS